MILDAFSHLEARAARAVRQARKRHAVTIAHRADAQTDKALRRQARKERTARQSYLSAMRGAEAWEA